LGSLLYDKRRHEEAITWWEKSAKLDRSFPTVWRNLGIAYYNVLHDLLAAKGAYQRAFKNGLNEDGAGGDARVLYERDQLWKRAGEPPRRRLDELEQHMDLVDARDDLTLEYCSLLNQVEQHEDALTILNSRHFQPWEGGEGLALAQWVRAHIALGRKALWLAPGDGGSPARALQLFTAGLHPPENLGEAFHLLQNNSELHYWAGMAARALGDAATASQHFATAAASVADFQRMSVCPYSENSLWAAEALRQLRRPEEARKLYEGMLAHAETLKKTPAKIDYFATSLPTMLIFDEDIQKRQTDEAALLEALARWGINGNRGQDKRLARHILTDLLQANPSHAIAADLLIALDWTN
jgi:tetratricopeptide (TPR) repeat protein